MARPAEGPRAARTPAGGRDAAGIAAFLACAALFWAVFLPQAGRSAFGRVPVLDEVYYLDRAAGMPLTAGAADEPYFMSPLYPILLRACGGGRGVPADRVLEPGDLLGVRLFQAGCWLAVVLLLRWTAGRTLAPDLTGRRRQIVLWTPALLFALYRPAAIYAASILLDLPLALCVAAVAALAAPPAGPPAAGPDRAGGARRFAVPVALGALVGAATLLRGTALALLPAAAWAAAVVRAGGARPRLAVAGATVLAAGLVMAPAILHNSLAEGRLLPPTLNGGVNLYIGNGPAANGFYVAAVHGEWREDPAGRRYLAERLDLQEVSLAQADRIWRDEALRAMAADPVRAAGLWLKKAWLHLQGWEIDQLTPLAAWVPQAPALRALVVPYGLIAGMGLFGLAACPLGPAGRRWALMLALLVGSQSVFFVVSRYRLALVPLLALLAGAGVRGLLLLRWRRAGEGVRWGRRHSLALLAMAAIYPWGLSGVQDLWRSMALANEARRWAELGAARDDPQTLERAHLLYTRALEQGAQGPAPWLGLAAVLQGLQRPAEAERTLREGSMRVPGTLDIDKAMVSLLLQDGRKPEALTWIRQVLASHPRDGDTLHNASVLLAELGSPEAALQAAEALNAAHPQDPRGYVDRGVLLARMGRRGEAAAVFRRGLDLLPDNADLRRNLDILQGVPSR